MTALAQERARLVHLIAWEYLHTPHKLWDCEDDRARLGVLRKVLGFPEPANYDDLAAAGKAYYADITTDGIS
jgi:hypothetical protein